MSASSSRRALSTLAIAAMSVMSAAAQQPTKKGTANTFEVIGNSGVSAQQVCLSLLSLLQSALTGTPRVRL